MKRALTALIVLMAQPAFAHAMLQHASPSAGASVTAPKEIVLQYSESLEPTFSKLELQGADGKIIAGKADISDTTMHLKLKPLPPGQYKVVWHAVSIDTHSTEGAYTFTVKP